MHRTASEPKHLHLRYPSSLRGSSPARLTTSGKYCRRLHEAHGLLRVPQNLLPSQRRSVHTQGYLKGSTAKVWWYAVIAKRTTRGATPVKVSGRQVGRVVVVLTGASTA
jgi:hypothetical protein